MKRVQSKTKPDPVGQKQQMLLRTGTFGQLISGIDSKLHLKQHEIGLAITQLAGMLFLEDNIDHNPSSRTATSSFHGTGISIFQFPSVENPGEVQENIKINSLRITIAHNELSLPRSYTFVSPLEKNLVVVPPIRK